MEIIKKHWKTIIVILSILLTFFLFLNHAHKYGAEYVFDMKSINGNSDNNSYGIRNDVYDFVKKDLDKPENKFLNDSKVKNLLLNYVKGRLMEIKYFSDQEKSIEISYQTTTMHLCLYLNKNKKVYQYMRSYITDNDGFHDTEFNSVFYKTKDHETIGKIVDSYMNGKTLNPDSRSPDTHPEICDKYYDHVLKDEEFYTKDSLIKGK